MVFCFYDWCVCLVADRRLDEGSFRAPFFSQIPVTLMSPEKREIKKETVLSSDEIFKGERCVVIEHNGDHYRLLITKTGKLVLNK